MKNRWTE